MTEKINFNTNPEMMDRLQEDAAYYLDQLSQGKDATEIAVQVYMKALGKGEQIAREMVKEIERNIEQYHNDLGMLGLPDLESVQNITEEIVCRGQMGLMDEALDERVFWTESPSERCRIYYQILLALEAYRIYTSGGDDAEERAKDYVAQYAAFNLSEEECVSREQELRQDVKNAYMNTTFLANEMSDLLTEIEFIDADEELATIAIGYGKASREHKLVLCTQAYVNAVNGVYKDLNAATGMKEMIYAVCIGVDTGALATEVTKGRVEFSAFQSALAVLCWLLGAVIGICLSIYLALTIVGLLGLGELVGLILTGVLFVVFLGIAMVLDSAVLLKIGEWLGGVLDKVTCKIVNVVRDAFYAWKAKKVGYKKSEFEKYCNQKAHTPGYTDSPKVASESPMVAEKYLNEDNKAPNPDPSYA